MAYTKQTWTNDVSPLNASRMNHIEDGIEANLVPSGTIMAYAGASAPTGWLLCDGSSPLRTTYPDLFTALGGVASPWGLPDGTHFTLPDLQGRIPVGKGTHADVNALADTDGTTLNNRRPHHRHTAHRHAYHSGTGAGANFGPNAEGITATSQSTAPLGTDLADGGSGNANDPLDTPAYVVVNYIIKI